MLNSRLQVIEFWKKRWNLSKLTSLYVQFFVLIALLFCHEMSALNIFASKKIWSAEQLDKRMLTRKGVAFDAAITKALIRLEMGFNFTGWEMKQEEHLFRIGSKPDGIILFSASENKIGLMEREGKIQLQSSVSDTGFAPQSNYQAVLSYDVPAGSSTILFFNRATIEYGAMELKILRRYAIGSLTLLSIRPPTNALTLKQLTHRGKVRFSWIKLVTQSPLQKLLEIVYFLWWGYFWWQLLTPLLKRFFSSVKNIINFKQCETRTNNVVVFLLAIQSYLLFNLLAIYLIPQHHFGELPGFLYLARDRFSDFIDVVTYTASTNPYVNEYNWDGPIYYPLILLLLKPLTIFYKSELVWGLVMFVIGSSWIGAHAMTKDTSADAKQVGLGLFLITLCSYPLLFGLDRGNVDLIILFMVIMYLVNLNRERNIAAGIWLGLAIAAKVFPGLFVLVALRRKNFKTPLVAGVTVVASSILAMELFGGDYAKSLEHFRFFYKRFEDVYLINSLVNFNFFSDPFSLLKSMITLGWLPMSSETLYKYYSKFALIFVLLITYVVLWKKEEPEYIQLGMIGVGVVVFPGLAYDYRLVFLFPALYSFFYRQESHPRDKVFWWFLFLILIPKHYGLIQDKWFLTCFVNPLLNIGFLAYCLLPHEKWVAFMKRLKFRQPQGERETA